LALNSSGTSKTADFLPTLRMPLIDSLTSSLMFFLKKLKIKPGDWYSSGHLKRYVIYPSIEHKIDLCDIFLVFPEIKARALERAFTAPS